MDDLVPPVVKPKPARGQELTTSKVPTDMFDTMRLMSAKHTLQGENLDFEIKKPRENTTEYYHEGYMDGKKYYVPDSNLEAMKDMINFEMRPRKSKRYRHQTSYEISDYDHFRGKLSGLLGKIDDISDLQLSSSDSENELKKIEESVKEEDSEEEEEEEGEEEESEEEEEKPPKKDLYHLRFLLSGHFKKDRKPFYVIQDYDGEPDLFKNHKADFFSESKEGNVDIFIKGKFYNESILEEIDGKPIALTTEPEKIKLEQERSRIYEKYFTETFNMINVDIVLRGEFIKNKAASRVTPFVSIGLKKKSEIVKSENKYDEQLRKKNGYNGQTNQTVAVYKPEQKNPFTEEAKDRGIDVDKRGMGDGKKQLTSLSKFEYQITENSKKLMKERKSISDQVIIAREKKKSKSIFKPFLDEIVRKDGNNKKLKEHEDITAKWFKEELSKPMKSIKQNKNVENTIKTIKKNTCKHRQSGEEIKDQENIKVVRGDTNKRRKSTEENEYMGSVVFEANSSNKPETLEGKNRDASKINRLISFIKWNKLYKTLFGKKIP